MQKNILILTGAGISQESGLDTFRDQSGIWSKVRIEDVATPEAFARDAARVHEFYNMRRRDLASGEVRPNAAHAALARLEAEWPGEVHIVTQNIDNLHEAAGTENLIHMHGELLKARCRACGAIHDWTEDLDSGATCPACAEAGHLRPHVVWFGEMPLEMGRIETLLAGSALFVSIGTSGNVYPAAGFVAQAPGHSVELNLEPSQGASLFAEGRHGRATEVVPAYVEEILTEGW